MSLKNPSESLAGKVEIATLAGGCFWGMEELFRKRPGVVSTRVGYTGGHTESPDYKSVCTETTGHAEAIEINFDPSLTNFAPMLDFFFRMHDPTTLHRQGNDRGTRYRSAIFFHSDRQRLIAEEMVLRAAHSKLWKDAIVTEVVAAGTFWPAEAEHQKYLMDRPNGYTCHFVRSNISLLDSSFDRANG